MKRRKYLIGLLTIITVFICSVLLIINQPVNNLDELWNYNFARCMYNGMLPYKDFSMITTPLSSVLLQICMNIFGDSLLVYRWCGIVLFLFLALAMYMFFNRYLPNMYIISSCLTMMILLLLLPNYRFDYNYLNLLIIIFILYFNCLLNFTWKISCVIGLLSGLTVCIKQTTGICIIIINIISTIIMFKSKNCNIKCLIIRILMSILPGIIMLDYLLFYDIAGDFMQYCISGVTSFSNKISYIQFMFSSPFNIIAGILFPIIIFCIVHKIIIEKNIMLLINFLFAFSGAVVMYPITDSYHFYIGAIPVLIIWLGNIKYKEIKLNENIICGVVTIIITAASITMLYPKGKYVKSKLNKYAGLNISRQLEEEIKNVDTFISKCNKNGKQVYIVDSSAAAYMIPLDKYTKDLDMLLIGNIGGKDFADIDVDSTNLLFLLRKDTNELNWQFDSSWYETVKNKYEKNGEVACFEIYETKD